MYKNDIHPPGADTNIEKWVSVENITDLSEKIENQKRQQEEKKRKLKRLRKELYIPITEADHYEVFSDLGFTFSYNPPGNGNCQFDAMCYLLHLTGIHRSARSLREEIVQYLAENPYNCEGFPLELFAGTPWAHYFTAMAQNGTYEDQLTLQAAAELFNVEILVVSSLGPDAATVISPISTHPTARLLLGHFAEGVGEHYVCLDEDSLLTELTGIESNQVQEKCIEEEQHNTEPTDPCQVDAPGI